MHVIQKILLGAFTIVALSACASKPAGMAGAQGFGSLDPGDVVKRSQEEGCQLIPYTAKRDVCVRENDGLHEPTACDAQSCTAGAGQAANRVRLAAWNSCVIRRTAIRTAFMGTVKDLKEFQRSPQWKGWEQKWKTAEKLIITKIEQGARTHQDQLRAAEQNLANCKRLLPHGEE